MVLGFSKQWPWDGEPTNFVGKIKRGIKIHTVREDQHNRWREGMDIHFATGVRTPDYNQFHSGVCTGVQEIEIVYHNTVGNKPKIFIDGNLLSLDMAKMFAVNDGFDSWEQFKKWFDEPFLGRIIHWTDFKY